LAVLADYQSQPQCKVDTIPEPELFPERTAQPAMGQRRRIHSEFITQAEVFFCVLTIHLASKSRATKRKTVFRFVVHVKSSTLFGDWRGFFAMFSG
jgi:hypothetical protein